LRQLSRVRGWVTKLPATLRVRVERHCTVPGPPGRRPRSVFFDDGFADDVVRVGGRAAASCQTSVRAAPCMIGFQTVSRRRQGNTRFQWDLRSRGLRDRAARSEPFDIVLVCAGVQSAGSSYPFVVIPMDMAVGWCLDPPRYRAWRSQAYSGASFIPLSPVNVRSALPAGHDPLGVTPGSI